jgi:predicted transcriptional regulator
LGVTKQAIKKHLNKLVDFGLVEEIKEKKGDQKIQYFQISPEVVTFAQVVLTPNFFQASAMNMPELLIDSMRDSHLDPTTSITQSKKDSVNYSELNFALKALGKQLHEVELNLEKQENERQKMYMEKVSLLNQLSIIINALVEDDLEKEVIFSLFSDVKSTVGGLKLEDIVNQMFLLKKGRSGVGKDHVEKPDDRMQERGRSLLKLLQLLLENFGFIHTEGRKIFFDFESH